MAETRIIRYGDKDIDVPDAMTLEQAKQQMARFFPELADPKVETKKDDGKTVWVFSKKAGHKGSTCANGALIRRLSDVRETPIAPAWLIDAVTGAQMASNDPDVPASDFEQLQAIEVEGRAVEELRGRLSAVPPSWPLESCLL